MTSSAGGCHPFLIQGEYFIGKGQLTINHLIGPGNCVGNGNTVCIVYFYGPIKPYIVIPCNFLMRAAIKYEGAC